MSLIKIVGWKTDEALKKLTSTYDMRIVKGENRFRIILTRIRDNEYRRRTAINATSKSMFPNATAAQTEEGAAAMVIGV